MEPTQELTDNPELNMIKKGSQVLLLRHANSQYNYEYDWMAKEPFTDEDYKTLRIKKDLRDAQLSKLGMQQWELSQALTNGINVGYVLMSPLRRAVETAYHMFKTHPSFDKIQFIIVPYMREAVDTVWDIPVNIQDIIDEYKLKFKNLDTSLFKSYRDPAHFYLRDIDQEWAKDILATKVEDKSDPWGSNAAELVWEHINEHYPAKSESFKNVVNRIGKVKKYIKDLIAEKNIEEDSKVVLCAHSYYFKMWTGVWERPIEEYGDHLPEPKEAHWLSNCEFYPDNVTFPKNT